MDRVLDYESRSWGFKSLMGYHLYSSIAQSVARLAVNQDVAGSSPAGGAIKISCLYNSPSTRASVREFHRPVFKTI